MLLACWIGLLAASPFLINPGLPHATDAELHVYRIAELGYSLRAGNLYPRWAPDFYHGYGYPIFNFYAPLTYHLGNWLTLLRPEQAAEGAKSLFVLAHLLGAMGAYLLGREFGGQGGGLLGAGTFAFAPYVLLINPHVRGDLAEVFALSLLPWTLWAWERLWQQGGRCAFIAAIVTASSVLLSHNLLGLTTMCLLLALSLWHWLVLRQTEHFGWALLAGVLVMALTAYFWLPFLLEREHIQLDVAGEGHYDYRNHFVPLRELLAPVPRQDWRASTIRSPMTTTFHLTLLATAGYLLAMGRRVSGHAGPRSRANTEARTLSRTLPRTLFYMLSTGLFFWLIMPGSAPLWRVLPGMAFFQFPWRFLGPLAVLLVPGVAALGDIPKQVRVLQRPVVVPPNVRIGVPIVLLLLVMGLGLPGLFPRPWTPGFSRDGIQRDDILEAELEGRWRGTTSTNDFVPTTVDMIPGPTASVLASYETSGHPVDRVNRYTLPEGATVELLDAVPWHNRMRVTTPQRFLLRLYLFDFPGWTAYIDGQVVPIEIAHPEGFITVSVPAGSHEVLVRFENTLPRKAGWGIAGVGCLLFIVATLRISPAPCLAEPASGPASRNERDTHLWKMSVITGLGLVSFTIVTIVLFNTSGLHYTSPLGEAWAAEQAQYATFGRSATDNGLEDGDISLLGFDVSNTQLAPGKSFEVTLYWQALRPITETYQSFVHVVHPEGQIWAQSDHLNPGGFPTNLWPDDRYVRDRHRLTLPPDVPAGELRLSVGLYTLQDDRRLPVLWAEAGDRGDNVILHATLKVRR